LLPLAPRRFRERAPRRIPQHTLERLNRAPRFDAVSKVDAEGGAGDESMLYLGFDCHKRTHSWALVDERGGLLDKGSVRNDPRDLHQLRLKFPEPIRVALEGSRGYRVQLHRAFRDVPCFEICAAWTHVWRQRGRPKPKNDDHDARSVARALAESHQDLVPLPPPRDEREALEIALQLWRQASHDRTATALRCHALLTRLWQGCYKDLFHDPLSKTGRAFFLAYPHPHPAARARNLAQRLHKWSRGQMGPSEADRVRLVARSFAEPTLAEQLAAEEVRELLERLDALERKQAQLRGRLTRLLRDLGCQWLLEEPGIGAIHAATLVDSGLLESPDDNGFAKLAGIAPEHSESGEQARDFNTRVRHEDLFTTLMDWAHWQAMPRSGVPLAQTYYARKRAEGKTRTMALRCLARQLIRRLIRLRNQARGEATDADKPATSAPADDSSTDQPMPVATSTPVGQKGGAALGVGAPAKPARRVVGQTPLAAPQRGNTSQSQARAAPGRRRT
jgi:transposase